MKRIFGGSNGKKGGVNALFVLIEGRQAWQTGFTYSRFSPILFGGSIQAA
jgi:hypothetical protein